MPKQKSKRAVQKRIKTRKSGSLQRSQAFTSHLFSNKSQKQKKHLRKQTSVSKADAKRYKDVM